MGLRTFLSRADEAVQDTKASVTAGVVMSVAALIVAVVALVVAIVRR